ncbi:MAG: hypothetical protein ACLP01_11570 [Solirubrobacteraceae bacterium]
MIRCEVCVRCSAGRKRDTWAQNPSTGEQGLPAVSYEPPGTYPEALTETAS